jgi:hypothetical protein
VIGVVVSNFCTVLSCVRCCFRYGKSYVAFQFQATSLLHYQATFAAQARTIIAMVWI